MNKPYRPPTVKSQQNLVEKFNKKYTIGDTIKVRQDDETIAEWTVTNEATMLGRSSQSPGHTAVIWCKESIGCYAADRVIFE